MCAHSVAHLSTLCPTFARTLLHTLPHICAHSAAHLSAHCPTFARTAAHLGMHCGDAQACHQHRWRAAAASRGQVQGWHSQAVVQAHRRRGQRCVPNPRVAEHKLLFKLTGSEAKGVCRIQGWPSTNCCSSSPVATPEACAKLSTEGCSVGGPGRAQAVVRLEWQQGWQRPWPNAAKRVLERVVNCHEGQLAPFDAQQRGWQCKHTLNAGPCERIALWLEVHCCVHVRTPGASVMGAHPTAA